MCLGLSAAPPLVSHAQASASHLVAATQLLGLVDHASCQGKKKFQKFCDVIWQQTRACCTRRNLASNDQANKPRGGECGASYQCVCFLAP